MNVLKNLEICSVVQGICPIAMLYKASSCVSAFDALVSLQPILPLNKNDWLP